MTRWARPCVVFGLVLALGVSDRRAPSIAAPQFSVTALLDQYGSGQFDEALRPLATLKDFGPLLKALRSEAPAWIAAEGSDTRARRELVAATFALEAARIDEWHEWKWVQKQPVMSIPQAPNAGSYQPRDVLSWRPAPLLIEWGCELMSSYVAPRPIERWWQLAALSVAQRSEDFQFLIGNAFYTGELNEIANPQDEIEHLLHVMKRFPDEQRFVLAQGIAAEWRWPRQAMPVFESLAKDPLVGAEALMRLGALESRNRRDGEAIAHFARAEKLTRDPYLVYLNNFLLGQIQERQQRDPQAERAYRRALAAVPGAQSASIALGSLLFRVGLRVEGREAARKMLETRPTVADPWREYAHADDRYWPRFLAKLRAEIQR